MQCKTMQCKTIKCKIDNHLEKSGQFWNRPENWQWSGKIRTVLKPSGKLAMIRKNPDRFGSIGRVEQVFSVVRAKTFRTRKNFPGSNATLLPRFLGLWFPPWERFFDFPFRSYSCFRKKIWLTCQKVFPLPTVGAPSASNSLSALSARAWKN